MSNAYRNFPCQTACWEEKTLAPYLLGTMNFSWGSFNRRVTRHGPLLSRILIVQRRNALAGGCSSDTPSILIYKTGELASSASHI